MSRKTTPPPGVAAQRQTKRTSSPGRKVDKPVASSALADFKNQTATKPRQPKLRKTPTRSAPPVSGGAKPKGKAQPSYNGIKRASAKLTETRERISAEVVQEARATGMLPHEWMLAVMRGEQISHFAYDAETQEIVEVIVLPTFADRIECAKSCAPYFANKLPNKPVGGGHHPDPSKQPGVMEVPLVASMQKWTELASVSQAHLKKEVTK